MDLFDIMHLGIEARQFHQVMRLREEVARLAYYTEIAAQKMELLNYYRQIIYWARQKNNELAGEIRNAPIQVFVLSSVIFNQINDIGITPDVFDDFSEKQYVDLTMNELRQNAYQSMQFLSGEQTVFCKIKTDHPG